MFRLGKFGLLSLEKRRLHGDRIAAFQYSEGSYRGATEGLCQKCSDWTSENGFKLREHRFR